MVIFAHSHGFTNEPEDFLYIVSKHNIDFSYLALSVFFFLSGLLVTQSLYQSSSWRNFLWKRFLRIYPAAWLAVLFCMLLLGPLVTTYSLKNYFTDPLFYHYAITLSLWKINFFLPGVYTKSVMEPSVNASLWSINLELKLYAGLLLFYIVKIPFKKTLLWWVLAGLLITDYFFFDQMQQVIRALVGKRFMLGPYTTYTPYFLAGVLCYLYGNKIFINRYLTIGSVLLGFAGIVFGGFYIVRFIIIPIFVLYAAASRSSLVKKITPHPDLSYGLYVFAFPLQQLISQLLETKNIHPWQMFLLSVAATLPFAIFSWYMVEKKALSLRKKIR